MLVSQEFQNTAELGFDVSGCTFFFGERDILWCRGEGKKGFERCCSGAVE